MVHTSQPYLGRLAPSPTGLLHLGHAHTFWLAAQRAAAAGGSLLLRNDDLDAARCRPEFVEAFQNDLRWLGLSWTEPMLTQSQRVPLYRAALARLHAAGHIYPCHHSRREIAEAASAPHENGLNDEPLYPAEWRPPPDASLPPLTDPIICNWRFRVPDGETVAFTDAHAGPQSAIAGRDFGDFLVWRKDDVPSYQLACALDDGELGITEVVRGDDLIKSTFRQLLLLRALGLPEPTYYHADLVTDDTGQRLAKRHDALSLRALRDSGQSPAQLIERF
ncbi:tRNA glutamyl-Q(34) synthetase GluQRS [Actomonas aquatica]|uniref:tRNA glutamyl-Q(34) synthetase GluQRS n=1 Tax=Actomonas aquatica TaxID=2866162 RepID=A0ABZ1CDT2_9BACT|nr:tRNA glutamyl-Q(34) synthetase GluQRS [Opitutus sp. WL0086]WRQ88794.1 tRNA glutamyl-Q(34) synthetase GluQRS [Opitutus sp. WL0086]